MKIECKVADTCIGCGVCVKDCGMAVLELKDGRPAVRPKRAEACMDCRHCVAVCPVGAFTVNGISAEDCTSLEEMPIPPPNELANLLRSRRSVRQFTEEEIPQDEIAALLETLKSVPTGCNVRHLVFTVVKGRKEMEACRQQVMSLLAAHLDALPQNLQDIVTGWQRNPACDVFFRHAPHLLIVHGSSTAVTPQVDCDATCAYFDLLAQSAGIGTVWFGFLSHIVAAVPEAADIFGIPRGAPFHAMLFGAPAVDYARCPPRADGAQVAWI